MTFTPRFRGRALLRAFVLAAIPSCGGPPPPAPSPTERPPRASPDERADAEVGTVELTALPGSVALYDPRRWRAGDGGSFTLLSHPPSHSTLALRVWRAARLVRPEECEAEARIARPTLPRPSAETLIDSRPLAAPRGFTGSLVVGVEPVPGGETYGYAFAVGAAIGRCFVLAFDTRAEGAGAPAVIGERLRAAADWIAPSVKLREIDERVTVVELK